MGLKLGWSLGLELGVKLSWVRLDWTGVDLGWRWFRSGLDLELRLSWVSQIDL